MTQRAAPDAETLAREVAHALLERIAAVQRDGRVPQIVLTGGTIATAIHRALEHAARQGTATIDWTRVAFWWGDERYVVAGSPDRNDTEVRAILERLGVPTAQVHPMPSSDSRMSLPEAATAYADELRSLPGDGFDVVMLGLGPDGHVASLFPGAPQLEERAPVVAVPDSPKPPPQRVSLSLGTLNRTASVWFVASGSAKTAAVSAAHRDGPVHEIPARGVRGRTETTWWLDDEAAALLD